MFHVAQDIPNVARGVGCWLGLSLELSYDTCGDSGGWTVAVLVHMRNVYASQNIYLLGGLVAIFIVPLILGISSSQLTSSIIFQRGLFVGCCQRWYPKAMVHGQKSHYMDDFGYPEALDCFFFNLFNVFI